MSSLPQHPDGNGSDGFGSRLEMRKNSAGNSSAQSLTKSAGALLVVAALACLVGCQGVSSGGSGQQPSGNLALGSLSLDFGSVSAGTSKVLTVAATNSGAVSATISSTSVSSKYFSLTTPNLPIAIGAGQSTTLSVTFNPNAAGTFDGTITINSTASNPVTTLSLSGTGAGAGQLVVNPVTESFGTLTVGTQQAQSVTLTNSGGASISISQVAIGGSGFQLSGITAPLTLNAAQSTTFTVTFAPQTSGNASGTVTITSDAPNPTLTLPLSGSGIAVSNGQLAVTPTTLGLGNVVDGTSGTATGSLTASGASVTVTAASTNNSVFSVGGLSLPVTIPAGQSVPFTVTFSPATSGAASATLSVTSNVQTSATTEMLTGTGTPAPTHTVALSWNASTSSNVSGYNIYRALFGTSCGSYAKINSMPNTSTLYTDSSVVDGTSYCYASTALNTSNEESGYSNIVSNIQIPQP